MHFISEFAPAKINLGLAVTGRLGNGYHALDTLFCTLDVGDTLHLERVESGIDLSIKGADLPATSDNLVYRAAAAYFKQFGAGGVRLHLEKHLPIAAGLGGGSSDAAACLRGLQRLYPSQINLEKIAVKLGADVPFLLLGGAARASGIGEILTPVQLPETHVVLANPKVGITAKEAYLGLHGYFGDPLELEQILAALVQGFAPPYRNDLEAPVIQAYPIVQEVKNVLERHGLFGVLMSGSGSTCFGLAKNASQAKEIAQAIQLEHPDWWVKSAKSYTFSSTQI